MGFQVAIDGPAGAGKSTISRVVAKRLSFIYVDTGAMYRAIALHLLRKGYKPSDGEKMVQESKKAQVSIQYRDGEQVILLGEEDVTGLIRTEEVSAMASACSALPEVRAALLDLQRNLARDFDVVMDGRDIGTTILPDAQVKIYLTASAEVRAKRRLLQDEEAGRSSSFEETLAAIIARDKQDMEREVSPLRQAPDAILVDSSEMSAQEVVETILGHVEARR